MRKIRRLSSLALVLIFITFSLTPVLTWAHEQPISPEEAQNYVGKLKTVCGKVASTHYANRSKGHPTFLNLNKPYPSQVFTVVIWGSDRSKFGKPPEYLYSDKEVCVIGKITVFRGTPEIIVKDPSQIRLEQ
jgi:DNA/RNA endonuclease YhcR with UshA esterase domain